MSSNSLVRAKDKRRRSTTFVHVKCNNWNCEQKHFHHHHQHHRSTRSAEDTENQPTSQQPPLDTRGILVVDDDPVSQLIVKSSFPELPSANSLKPNLTCLVVTTASSVMEATVILDSQQPLLVLLDVVLPDSSGYQLLEKIASNERLHTTPVLLMSGLSNPPDESVIGIAADWLPKPIGRDLLRKKVEIAVNAKRKAEIEEAYKKEVGYLRDKLSSLDRRLSTIFESPLQNVMRKIRRAMREPHADYDTLRQYLDDILHDLEKSNVYRPSIDNLFERADLDSVSKSFLSQEFDFRATPISSCDSVPSLQMTGRMVGKICNWLFNQLHYSEEYLVTLTLEIFDSFDLYAVFHIERQKLFNFVCQVKSLYKHNKYHNWRHAFDVLSTGFFLIVRLQLTKSLTHLDILAFFIASLCHDVRTQQFTSLTSSTPVAIRYNDLSVLENLHACIAFKLMRDPNYNFLSSLPREIHQTVRKMVISLILQTDMAQHLTLLNMWRATLIGKIPARNPEIRQALLGLLIKAGDLSNPTKLWEVAHTWSHWICTEMFAQAEKEKSEGLPVAPYMDREQVSVAKVSVTFIDLSAAPLFLLISELFPEAKPLYECLLANRAMWQKLMDESVKCIAEEDTAKCPALCHPSLHALEVAQVQQIKNGNLGLDLDAEDIVSHSHFLAGSE